MAYQDGKEEPHTEYAEGLGGGPAGGDFKPEDVACRKGGGGVRGRPGR